MGRGGTGDATVARTGREGALLCRSVVAVQIHAAVQARHLGVAVEHQGRLALLEEACTDDPLGGLAPARMRYIGIDVGVEAVLVRRHDVPRVRRLSACEFDLDDGLAALEAIFPWRHDPQRRAVDGWQLPS